VLRASGLLATVKAFIKVLEARQLDMDFTVIVSSDHGGQWERNEDEICNHGCRIDGGNEGFLYIWNQRLGGSSEHWITTEQLAPTLAQTVLGAGVPLHSIGHPVPLHNSSNSYSAESQYIAMRSKEIQLQSLLKLLDPTHDTPLERIQGILLRSEQLAEEMPGLVDKYPLELASLEQQIAQLMRPRAAEAAVFALLAVFAWEVWREVSVRGLDGFIWALALVEPCALLLTGDVLTRVEYVIYGPVIAVLGVSAP
jgi:hypothetical protein